MKKIILWFFLACVTTPIGAITIAIIYTLIKNGVKNGIKEAHEEEENKHKTFIIPLKNKNKE